LKNSGNSRLVARRLRLLYRCFLFDSISAQYNVHKDTVVYTLTLTLAMRPIGAFLFGRLADRFGRKVPLIACVLYFSP
jgi:SHS family lactate transporter-like MFS transporter